MNAASGRRRALIYGAAGVAAAAVGTAVAWRLSAPNPTGVLYAQTLEGLDGAPHALAQWRGRPLVLNFWASWCTPCVEEMPELNALHGEFGSRVQFVGIGIDTAGNIRKFIKKIPVDYTLLLGGNAGPGLARHLGNNNGGLPFTVVIDAKERVIQQYSGRIKADALRKVLATV